MQTDETFSPLLRSLRQVAHSEAIIANIRLHQVLSQLALILCSTLAGLIGLVLANTALWLWLEPQTGASAASAIAATINLALAGAFLVVGIWVKRPRELAIAEELHRAAVNDLMSETRHLETGLVSVGSELRAGAVGLLKPSLDVALAQLLVPAAVFLLQTLRRRRSRGAAESKHSGGAT